VGRQQERWPPVVVRDRDGVVGLIVREQLLVGLRRRAGGAGWAKAVGVDILVVVPVAVIQE
jgi:hypothetical protein